MLALQNIERWTSRHCLASSCKDWLIKEWYPQHTIWTSCVWLWPIDQAVASAEECTQQVLFNPKVRVQGFRV